MSTMLLNQHSAELSEVIKW